MDLQELVSITENLTDGCQRILLEALREIIYRQKGLSKLKPCVELDRIVDIGIIDSVNGRYGVAEIAKKNIRKLYTYLVRKFDTVPFFDPETCQVVDIPKGANFVSTLDVFTMKMKLHLEFPDDEITDLLNLFGANRCDDWTL